ncbi:cation:proton antiporter [Neorhizobium sp. T786]|uniref:cation:proton antiporter n=1 Tax=Pseudorhizobium xiangyangii TaxID=2883104 RepID=UPI001CFFE7B7|nr:cation:proton antiporter [Neorhizobium xiangyangii]MCB5202767.1 cation:proton antiporter [Neorhizobium xiangyangii]
MTSAAITQFAVNVGLFVLGVSFLLTVWRVIKGPTLPDRVIALDMLVGIVMGFIALIAIRTGFTLYIDIAISLGLVGFLATVAFARFILSRKARAGEDGTRPPAVPVVPAGTAAPPAMPKATKPKPAKSSDGKQKAASARQPEDKPKTKRKPATGKGET